ncbi:MAG: hypothetical protein NC413_08600 [Muribaculum sp.]|nr:hypothetical protein [Muribaculum sp.]
MANRHKANKVVRTVPVMLGSIAIGIVLWSVLIGLLFIVIPQYFEEQIREIRPFLYTEARGIKMAKKALQEKYGEEFIIHDVWSKASHEFYADCSPVSNEEIVFQAVFWNDGRGIEYDEYIQGVISWKISERFQQELEQIYDDCYVHTFISYAAAVEFDNVPDTTIEQYAEKYQKEHEGRGRWIIDVFINLEQEQEGDIEREYEYLSQIGLEQEKSQMPDIYFDLYGVDEETKNWCENYFSTHALERGEFTTMESKNPYFYIRYKDGEITRSLEEYREYKELRNSLLYEE